MDGGLKLGVEVFLDVGLLVGGDSARKGPFDGVGEFKLMAEGEKVWAWWRALAVLGTEKPGVEKVEAAAVVDLADDGAAVGSYFFALL